MNIEKRERPRGAILFVDGRVDSGNASAFEAALMGHLNDAQRGIVLDLAKLEYISSAGLRVVLLIAKAADQKKLPFAVCSLTEDIAELFTITGFDTIIPLEATVDDCLKRFGAS